MFGAPSQIIVIKECEIGQMRTCLNVAQILTFQKSVAGIIYPKVLGTHTAEVSTHGQHIVSGRM